MKKFNSFRNRQNGFEDLGSGTAEAAKSKKSWWKVPVTILVILVNFRSVLHGSFLFAQSPCTLMHKGAQGNLPH